MNVLNLPAAPYMVCAGTPYTDLLRPYWQGSKVPPIPAHPILFSEDSNDWFKFLCDCMSLAKRDDETHVCSSYALNRRIQNAYKNVPLKIDFAEYLTRAWCHAGIEALAAMALYPPVFEYDFWLFDGYRRDCSGTAATECSEPIVGECYHSISYYQRRQKGLDGPPRYWTVAAQDNFGIYRSYMLSDEPPDRTEIEDICRWEYRVQKTDA